MDMLWSNIFIDSANLIMLPRVLDVLPMEHPEDLSTYNPDSPINM